MRFIQPARAGTRSFRDQYVLLAVHRITIIKRTGPDALHTARACVCVGARKNAVLLRVYSACLCNALRCCARWCSAHSSLRALHARKGRCGSRRRRRARGRLCVARARRPVCSGLSTAAMGATARTPRPCRGGSKHRRSSALMRTRMACTACRHGRVTTYQSRNSLYSGTGV